MTARLGVVPCFLAIAILAIMNQARKKRSEKKADKHAASGQAGKPTKLRIIGGEFRGRRIDYHGAAFTRPMKDNIRENLFNILGQAVRGAIVFDCFAGTGALAFESLSRGAQSAILIEQNRNAVSYLRSTAESLGVAGRVEILTGDAFRLGAARLTCPEEDTPWIVFLCPPYALWEESFQDLRGLILRFLEHAPLGSVLVAETEKRFDVEGLPGADWDFRLYGNTRLGFLESEARCGLRL
jgi:16S rRNA (guanine966-N2)-methyltransferase